MEMCLFLYEIVDEGEQSVGELVTTRPLLEECFFFNFPQRL